MAGAFGVDVGHLVESGAGVRRAVTEVMRIEAAIPAVTAGDVLDAVLGRHGVECQPHGAHLLAVDGPLRLILVPRRALARARLLH